MLIDALCSADAFYTDGGNDHEHAFFDMVELVLNMDEDDRARGSLPRKQPSVSAVAAARGEDCRDDDRD